MKSETQKINEIKNEVEKQLNINRTFDALFCISQILFIYVVYLHSKSLVLISSLVTATILCIYDKVNKKHEKKLNDILTNK